MAGYFINVCAAYVRWVRARGCAQHVWRSGVLFQVVGARVQSRSTHARTSARCTDSARCVCARSALGTLVQNACTRFVALKCFSMHQHAGAPAPSHIAYSRVRSAMRYIIILCVFVCEFMTVCHKPLIRRLAVDDGDDDDDGFHASHASVINSKH